MNAKRCGLPDLYTAGASGAGEFVTGAGKWSTNTLTYSFQEYSPDIPAGDIRWAVDQALGLWSAETPLRRWTSGAGHHAAGPTSSHGADVTTPVRTALS